MPPPGPDTPALRDALRFWERGRLLYVLALAATVLLVAGGPAGLAGRLVPGGWLGLFSLAVIANLLYCLAYVPEGLAMLLGVRHGWRPFRPPLLVLGTLLGCLAAWALTPVLLGADPLPIRPD
ncbi:hypothetical protein M0638_16570 [Roseomonas sp. NAR14]|uniref:Uncharacterized protein n=1 Tax=Roseomonas acroporae TaxID=2937791 RepID=A0A9X1YA45_9PROT|nr:hypothetical protein [Roseomonas acroporae]MCK8785992.1 hypothetical protein [Roseomonas acroporae]